MACSLTAPRVNRPIKLNIQNTTTQPTYRLQFIIKNNEDHLITLLDRLEQLELVYLLESGIISADDWRQIIESHSKSTASVIYKNLKSADDATICNFLTTVRASKHLSPALLKIVDYLDQVVQSTKMMDQHNPRKRKLNEDQDDFPVTKNDVGIVLKEITKSPVALREWSELKHEFLHHPRDIHEIEVEQAKGRIDSIIRKTLELWIARSAARKPTFNRLIDILDKCDQTVSESLRRIRHKLA